MSLTVVVQEAAIRALARIRSEDKDAFAQIRRAMSALADQPRRARSVATRPPVMTRGTRWQR